MATECPNAQKHVALSALLVRVLQSFGFQDVQTMIHNMGDAFLRPWTAYRDNYLLEPKFNLEGLRPSGEDLGMLIGHIIREVNGRTSRRTNQLGQDAGGRSHTVRLFSSLIHEFTRPGCFYDGGRKEDIGWLSAACQDLFLMVKLLREEYAHGHGDLMDAIEERYPSKWFSEADGEEEDRFPMEEDKAPKRYEENIPESDISEYEEPGSDSRSSSSSLVKRNKVAQSQADYDDPKIYYEGFSDGDDPDIYYEGFTEYESSEESDEAEEDGEFPHNNTGTAVHVSRLTDVATEKSPAMVGFQDVRGQNDGSLARKSANVSFAAFKGSAVAAKAMTISGHFSPTADSSCLRTRQEPGGSPGVAAVSSEVEHSQRSLADSLGELDVASRLLHCSTTMNKASTAFPWSQLAQPSQNPNVGDPIEPHGLSNSSQSGIKAAVLMERPVSDLHLMPRQGTIGPSNIPTSKRSSFRMPFVVSDSESGDEGSHEPHSPVRQQGQPKTQTAAIHTEEEAPNSPTDPTFGTFPAAFNRQSQSSGSIAEIDDHPLFVSSPGKRPLKPSHSRHAALLDSVPNDPPQPEIPRRSATELGLFLELSERRAPPMLSFFDPSTPFSGQSSEDPFIEEWSYFGNQ